MLPTRLLLIHPHLSSGLYKRGLDRGVGVLLQGGQLPRQPGEIAGRVPGYVLRVLWSHLASPPDEGFHSAKLSRLRTPRSVEISPSMAERDLLTSEPALIGARVLTPPHGAFDQQPRRVPLRPELHQPIQLPQVLLQFRAIPSFYAALQFPQEVSCQLLLAQLFSHPLSPLLHRAYLPISLCYQGLCAPCLISVLPPEHPAPPGGYLAL